MKILKVYIENSVIKEKQFDCVKFKNELHQNLLKQSGAKNLQEYIIYANEVAQKSSLHKTTKNTAINAV